MFKFVKSVSFCHIASVMVLLSFLRVPLLIMFDFSDIHFEFYFYFIYAMLAFFSLWGALKRKMPKSLLLCICFVSFVLLNCLRPGVELYVRESIVTLVVFLILPFLIIQYIDNFKKFSLILSVAVFLHYILGIVDCFLFFKTGQAYGKDAMLATYAIAMPTSYYMYRFFVSDEKKTIYLVLTAIGTVLTILSGSRGGLLLFAFSILLGFLHSKNIKSILLPLFFAVLISSYFMSSWLDGLIGGSRIVEVLRDNSLTESDRGTLVWIPVFNAIIDSPIIGWGTFGDRIVNSSHSWAHNFFLELFCDYGLIFGTIFAFWFLSRSYFHIIKNRDQLFVELFLMSFPQLLLSSSYLQSSYFWIYLGFLFACRKRHYIERSKIIDYNRIYG